MPEPFDPRTALEMAAELAAELTQERGVADTLERIAAARDAARDAPEAEAFASLLGSLSWLAEHASESASRDEVTGLANRRGFDAALRHEVERSYRTAQPVSALAVALDHFERVTDAGVRDRALRQVAEVLRGCLRQVDTAARVGTAAFRILLPNAGLDGAREVAERCRCAIAALNLPDVGALTATFGVATHPDHAANSAGLAQAADAALATGERRGRNCVAAALPLTDSE